MAAQERVAAVATQAAAAQPTKKTAPSDLDDMTIPVQTRASSRKRPKSRPQMPIDVGEIKAALMGQSKRGIQQFYAEMSQRGYPSYFSAEELVAAILGAYRSKMQVLLEQVRTFGVFKWA